MEKVRRKSLITGKVRTLELDVTKEQLQRWEEGELVQEVFPDLSANDREFIMTGITAEEWDEVFDEEDPEKRA